jgi:hypothetical protein
MKLIGMTTDGNHWQKRQKLGNGITFGCKRKNIRWKQDLNLRGETPSDIIRTIQITRLNDSAIPAD